MNSERGRPDNSSLVFTCSHLREHGCYITFLNFKKEVQTDFNIERLCITELNVKGIDGEITYN